MVSERLLNHWSVKLLQQRHFAWSFRDQSETSSLCQVPLRRSALNCLIMQEFTPPVLQDCDTPVMTPVLGIILADVCWTFGAQRRARELRQQTDQLCRAE